jgi:four helix bundle protein
VDGEKERQVVGVSNVEPETARSSERRKIPNGARSRTAQNPEERKIPNGASPERRKIPKSAKSRRARVPKDRLKGIASCYGDAGNPTMTHIRDRHRKMPGMTPRNLDVLDAAELAAERLNALIDRVGHRRLLHVAQMRKSAQSVGGNISEGFGRTTRAERDNKLRVARGESEETICHLRANWRTKRINSRDYWPVCNVFRTVTKMLDSLLNG